jgi:flagellar biosynthesis protein FlhG
MTVDQATRLRELAEEHETSRKERASAELSARSKKSVSPVASSPHKPTFEGPPRLAHATAFVSGKGGVGKSNLALNLAIALGCRGRRVVLFDADMGMANLDVLCGLTPTGTLEDVVRGRTTLRDILVQGPGGFQLVPGASGVASMANIDGLGRRRLLKQLAMLDSVADHLLIDMGAGISSSVMSFAAAADRVVVVTTPEPTSMTDAYGAIKALASRGREMRLDLVVNMAHSDEEGLDVHKRISRVARKFLGVDLALAGVIPHDPLVSQAVRVRRPVLLESPHAPVTRAIDRLARHLEGLPVQRYDGEAASQSGASKAVAKPGGFFQRLAGSILSRGR